MIWKYAAISITYRTGTRKDVSKKHKKMMISLVLFR